MLRPGKAYWLPSNHLSLLTFSKVFCFIYFYTNIFIESFNKNKILKYYLSDRALPPYSPNVVI